MHGTYVLRQDDNSGICIDKIPILNFPEKHLSATLYWNPCRCSSPIAYGPAGGLSIEFDVFGQGPLGFFLEISCNSICIAILQ